MKAYCYYIFFLILILTSSCKKDTIQKIDPDFKTHILGFTSGVVSAASPIKIQFTENIASDSLINKPIKEKILRLIPKTDGITFWENKNTLVFQPSPKLCSGTTYKAVLSLRNIRKEVSPKLREFNFNFKTINLNFKIEEGILQAYDDKYPQMNSYTGMVFTTDVVEQKSLEKILSAKQNGRQLPIQWRHFKKSGLYKHRYTIDSIRRIDEDDSFTMTWNGKSINVHSRKSQKIKIIGLQKFIVTKIKTIGEKEQYVIAYSEPISKSQNIDGLIRIKNESDPNIVVEKNMLKIYPKTRLSGNYELVFAEGIKSIYNRKLKKDITYEVVFQSLKPVVELVGKGTIMPGSNALIFPFRAVNLKSINLRIIKIFVNNVPQFLQINDNEGNRQIRRVGRLVLNKKIDLITDKKVINYKE